MDLNLGRITDWATAAVAKVLAGILAHLLFVEDFHGVELLLLFVLREHHPPERARPEGLQSLEVVEGGRVLEQVKQVLEQVL